MGGERWRRARGRRREDQELIDAYRRIQLALIAAVTTLLTFIGGVIALCSHH